VGTVPIYEALRRAKGNVKNMTVDLILDVIEEQAEQGVSYMTIHAGVLKEFLPLVQHRVMGVVEMAGYYGDYGKAVLIKHPSGYMTLYGHLSEISVKAGQEVKAGQVIGKVGSTGRSTGPHLHYEVLYQGKLKNPMEYIVWR